VTFIAVANGSTKFSDQDAVLATRAVAHQVRYHAAPAWGLHAPPVVFVGHIGAVGTPLVPVPDGSYVLGFFDTDDQPDALAWHSEDAQGNVFGRVNVGAILDNGGTPLSGGLTVASALSHEVLEAMVDPNCNRWALDPDGKLWAVEVGDPVESSSYDVRVDGTSVSVSDFVYPAWFDDSPAASSRTHHLDTGLTPFTIDHGGYAVTWAAGGQPSQEFGESYPEWKKTTKMSRLARTSRRVAV
jgi:hypothetical protein